MSNLRQIGIACFKYASAHYRSALPDSLATLYVSVEMHPDDFLCPSGNDVYLRGTEAEIAAKLTSGPPPGSPGGGNSSYHYTGKGLTLASPAGAVVAYEPLINHSDGGHVLYLDGQVLWKDAKQLQVIGAAIQAGANPPP